MYLRLQLALLFCLSVFRLAAQNPTATLIGSVLDPSNAVVAGADVRHQSSP